LIDGAQYELMLDEAEKALKSFVTTDGAVAFDTSAHIVTATKE
jgi:hypothetical protein